MQPLNLELDLELNSDVDKAFNCLVRLLRNRNITQYIENHPAAYNEVLAAVQEIPQPKPLPTPASTPQEEPDPDGQADQHKNNLVDLHDQSYLAVKQELSPGGRPLYHAYVEDADDSSVQQTSDNSQRSANLDVWPPSDHNNDTYDQDARQDKQPSEHAVTSSIPHRLDTTQHTSSKRKQHFEDGGASKRAHIELADATEGGPGNSSAGYPTRWTYEKFALRYYMLIASSSRTSEIRDLANKILTKSAWGQQERGLG